MSLREAERKPIPKPGEAGGPPVGWRTPSKWNQERIGITNRDKMNNFINFKGKIFYLE